MLARIRRRLKRGSRRFLELAHRFLFPNFYAGKMARHVARREAAMELLPVFCNREQDAVDVGVLWGAYSFELSRYARHCHAFEPNPRQVRFLRRAFRNTNVTIYPVAASAQAGTMRLRVPEEMPGHATVERANPLAGDRDILECDVQSERIDAYRLQDVSFVKIDVEGHEAAVVKGMRETIERDRPVVLAEIAARHNSRSMAEMLQMLTALDYQGYFYVGGLMYPIRVFNHEIHQTAQRRKTRTNIGNFIFLPAGFRAMHLLRFASDAEIERFCTAVPA